MYDVLYRDRSHHDKLIATGLAHQAACELARAEARRRHAGRMFAAGSELGPLVETVLIVDSRRRSAA